MSPGSCSRLWSYSRTMALNWFPITTLTHDDLGGLNGLHSRSSISDCRLWKHWRQVIRRSRVYSSPLLCGRLVFPSSPLLHWHHPSSPSSSRSPSGLSAHILTSHQQISLRCHDVHRGLPRTSIPYMIAIGIYTDDRFRRSR